MTLRQDNANHLKPHLVFKASKFQSGEDWHDEEERQQWDPRCVISFQENAWVDAETHIHAMNKVLKPFDEYLEETGQKGLTIEDNLSSHKTDAVFKYWEEELTNFLPPQFVPANMTETIQVIDRHIGILYKRAVYRVLRAEMLKRLREARAAAGGAEGVTPQPLLPSEKRILITKAVADCHEKLTKAKNYHRAFIATANWMPVPHLMRNDDGSFNGDANVPEDYEVSLQHLSEYDYAEQFSRDKILPEIEKINKEKADAIAAEQRREADEAVAHAADLRSMQSYVNKASSIMANFEVS